MSSVTVVCLNTLLQKTEHYDKDERWMAASDLCTFMQRSPGLDSATEGRICTAILNLLNDESADVQAIAVRTLTTLYSICTPQLRTIAQTLLGRMMSEDDSGSKGKSSGLRDVYANGLKKLLAVLSEQEAQVQVHVIGVCVEPLMKGVVSKKDDMQVALYSLEVLSELMLYFGKSEIVTARGERIMGVLLGVIKGNRSDLTKRAIPCLGRAAAHLNLALVERTVDTLMQEIQLGGTNLPVYVQTLSSLAQYCGRTLRCKSEDILELLMRFVDPNIDDDEQDDDEEAISTRTQLRESTFTAISSLITSNQSIVIDQGSCNLEKIDASLRFFLKYDPNFFDDVDDEDEAMEDNSDVESDMGSLEDEEDYEEFGADEDDDESWKIRRAALRCATSLVKTCQRNADAVDESYADRQSLEAFLWTKNGLAATLISRMKNERENHVLLDVLSSFQSLLEVTIQTKELVLPMEEQILSNCITLLKEKGPDVKISILGILRNMSAIGSGSKVCEAVVQQVLTLLTNESKNLKFAALTYLSSLPPQPLPESEFDKIVNLTQAQGEWYKIHALALEVLARIVPVYSYSTTFSQRIITAMKPTFEQPDLDSTIKIATLTCLSSLLTSDLGKSLTENEVCRCIQFMCKKCEEISVRSKALRALLEICTSSTIDMSRYFLSTLGTLSNLLSREQKLSVEYIRTFKQGVLEVILALLPYGNAFTDTSSNDLETTLDHLLHEIGELVVPSDLHISDMALRATLSTLNIERSRLNVAKLITSNVLAPSIDLASSPLVSSNDDPSLVSISKILQFLVKNGSVEFKELYNQIHNRASVCDTGVSTSKRVLHNLAVCIASITAVAPDEDRLQVQNELISVIKSPNNDVQLLLGLFTIGELGRQIDLSSENLFDVLFAYLNDSVSSEDVKSCAAYSLGHFCIGSMSTSLELLLNAFERVQEARKTQYLLLTSLREIITYHHKHQRSEAIEKIPIIEPHLFKNFGIKEEGVRTMVAECMGALGAIQPSYIYSKIAEFSKDMNGEDKFTSWTVVNSIRCSVVKGVDGAILVNFLSDFLKLLDCRDLEVKCASLLMVNSIVHYQPDVLLVGEPNMLSSFVFPCVYEAVKLKERRVVELGPFKEVVDDALPTRRAALSVFATCLKNCPRALDLSLFLPMLASALGDVQDIQLQAHQTVIFLSTQSPSALVDALDSFVDPLRKTCKMTIKGQKTDSEKERINEW
eukprot:CAMPEP_0116065498 /NCGR_PEP_ID=MMETSP0322-20121206/9805_1 /TAXON_ID=163516 /ORGANISM="Leptocylindrus danicus var. apora, Strain B651" /LENGTH=1218 /DNA_ID=CAMNT_0003551837 /DNA_START=41 /DNA_END=3694 /DNA_ORIENTATION=-